MIELNLANVIFAHNQISVKTNINQTGGNLMMNHPHTSYVKVYQTPVFYFQAQSTI